jgi:hypothetical protein
VEREKVWMKEARVSASSCWMGALSDIQKPED